MIKSKKLCTVIALLLICITVNIIGVSQTMAWFVSGGLLGSGDYSTAKVQYLPNLVPDEKEKYGSLLDGSTDQSITYLIPGDAIIKKFNPTDTTPGYLSIQNFSTVVSEVRATIDCNFILEDVVTGKTSLSPMEDFKWINTGGDTFQFGTEKVADGNNVFMGLIEVTFSNKAVKDTTYPGYLPPTGDTADTTNYNWAFVGNAPPATGDQVDFTNSWNLILGGGTIIPETDGQNGRAYNAISDMKIVALNNDYQDLFNQYFSENYAGRRIRIAIKYYAKQTMGMEWNMFNQQILQTTTP